MEQKPNQEQIKEQQSERRREQIGTSLQEIYENMRKRKKHRFSDGCNDEEHNDDDSDCFCD